MISIFPSATLSLWKGESVDIITGVSGLIGQMLGALSGTTLRRGLGWSSSHSPKEPGLAHSTQDAKAS